MARLGHSSPRAAMIYQHAATATIAAILVQFLCNARVPKTRPE
jgi:hypothetical protein